MISKKSDDPDETDILHLSAQSGDLKEVNRLLAIGTDPNLFDDLGKTPLTYAAESGHIEVMKVLLESGADPNIRCEEKAGNTVLGEVVGNCSYEVAKLLVDAGANPKVPGSMQLTALYKAEKRKRDDGPKVYELLKSAAKKF